MGKTIGVVMTSRIVAGLVEDHALPGSLNFFPEDPDEHEALLDLPVDSLCERIGKQVAALKPETKVEAIGVAMPGIIRGGAVADSPNLPQLKGANMAASLKAAFAAHGIDAPVKVLNDADAVAAGLAATEGHLDRVVRVWTIGNGIGFGRYPYREGVWEGGHTVVSLDPKEGFCGCGGKGHLEGIMGHRAMRLRFLDMEPEEVFAMAKKGESRCLDFVELWHRALSAATATSIHLDGPGRFYFTGNNVRFLDLNLLKEYLWQMVKMSPLQSYTLQVVPLSDDLGVIGSAATALFEPS
ncbi:MAG TPA: ROK family protein [Acidobacteriaceae bacterium]|jgi:predicted NBD/HSP70 family sugar kinase